LGASVIATRRHAHSNGEARAGDTLRSVSGTSRCSVFTEPSRYLARPPFEVVSERHYGVRTCSPPGRSVTMRISANGKFLGLAADATPTHIGACSLPPASRAQGSALRALQRTMHDTPPRCRLLHGFCNLFGRSRWVLYAPISSRGKAAVAKWLVNASYRPKWDQRGTPQEGVLECVWAPRGRPAPSL